MSYRLSPHTLVYPFVPSRTVTGLRYLCINSISGSPVTILWRHSKVAFQMDSLALRDPRRIIHSFSAVALFRLSRKLVSKDSLRIPTMRVTSRNPRLRLFFPTPKCGLYYCEQVLAYVILAHSSWVAPFASSELCLPECICALGRILLANASFNLEHFETAEDISSFQPNRRSDGTTAIIVHTEYVILSAELDI